MIIEKIEALNQGRITIWYNDRCILDKRFTIQCESGEEFGICTLEFFIRIEKLLDEREVDARMIFAVLQCDVCFEECMDRCRILLLKGDENR